MRTAALALTVILLVLAGCTWSGAEPGLLQQREASTAPSSPVPPAATNPRLPVAGETTWTTDEVSGSPPGSRYMLSDAARV